MRRRLPSRAVFLFAIWLTQLVRQTWSHFSLVMVMFHRHNFGAKSQNLSQVLWRKSVCRSTGWVVKWKASPASHLWSQKMPSKHTVNWMVMSSKDECFTYCPARQRSLSQKWQKKVDTSSHIIFIFSFKLIQYFRRGSILQTEASAETESTVWLISQLERTVLGPERCRWRHGQDLQHLQGTDSQLGEQRQCGSETSSWWNPNGPRYETVPRAKWRQPWCIQSSNFTLLYYFEKFYYEIFI